MDFGIARVLGTSRLTKQGNILGTIEYMSPEQVRGQDTDARSDIYSLGILLYEMLTGRVPFSSDSEFDLMKMQIDEAPPPPRVFSAQIPQAVEQAIMKSLAKRPEARFQSAGDFRNALMTAGGVAASPSMGTAAGSPPATRLGESAIAQSHMPAATPKETRLGTDASTGFQGDQLKATRLSGEGNAAFAYGANAPAGAMYQQPAAMPSAAKSSAKLFIGIAAAAVIVTIIGISIAMLGVGKKQSAAPAVTPPVQSVTPQPAPSAGAGQPSIPAQPPPPQVDTSKPSAGGLDGGASFARPNTRTPAKRRQNPFEEKATPTQPLVKRKLARLPRPEGF